MSQIYKTVNYLIIYDLLSVSTIVHVHVYIAILYKLVDLAPVLLLLCAAMYVVCSIRSQLFMIQ